MNGTTTKYRKKNGRISWGYHYKAEGRHLIRLLGHISIRDLEPAAIQEAVNCLQLRGGVSRRELSTEPGAISAPTKLSEVQ